MNRREELIDVQCQIESLSTQVRPNKIIHVCVVFNACFCVYEQNTQKIWLRHIAWSGITIDNGVIILSGIRPPNAQAGHFHIDLCNLVIIICMHVHWHTYNAWIHQLHDQHVGSSSFGDKRMFVPWLWLSFLFVCITNNYQQISCPQFVDQFTIQLFNHT